jgi:hypothetical protein
MLIMGSQDTRMHHWLTEIAMEPKSKADLQRLNGALATRMTVHSASGVSTDPQSGQIIP